jgi:hypothetical protein
MSFGARDQRYIKFAAEAGEVSQTLRNVKLLTVGSTRCQRLANRTVLSEQRHRRLFDEFRCMSIYEFVDADVTISTHL